MEPRTEDPGLRRLVLKHREYESRLANLRQRRFPTEEEQREEAMLKKLKLKLKDEIEALRRREPGPVGRHG
jgi:uncharacterized protein YdcH (DUF465 family)